MYRFTLWHPNQLKWSLSGYCFDPVHESKFLRFKYTTPPFLSDCVREWKQSYCVNWWMWFVVFVKGEKWSLSFALLPEFFRDWCKMLTMCWSVHSELTNVCYNMNECYLSSLGSKTLDLTEKVIRLVQSACHPWARYEPQGALCALSVNVCEC